MSSGLIPVPKRTPPPAQYGELADVPPEIEWLANITNKKTRLGSRVFQQSHMILKGMPRRAGCLPGS